MPLPEDYNSQDGEEEAEIVIRQAIADCFLVAGTPYGFTSSLVHARPRYPRNDTVWYTIGTIPDPDTVDAETPEGVQRLTRFFSVKFAGFKRTLTELILRYEIVISFGFKDEYSHPDLAGQNSHDQLAGCSIRFGRFLAENLNLGLDDRVTHTYLDIFGRDFIPLDEQGNAAEALAGRLEVVLEVC